MTGPGHNSSTLDTVAEQGELDPRVGESGVFSQSKLALVFENVPLLKRPTGPEIVPTTEPLGSKDVL
jgi:hypothetical protein